jgi:hypothetical protein
VSELNNYTSSIDHQRFQPAAIAAYLKKSVHTESRIARHFEINAVRREPVTSLSGQAITEGHVTMKRWLLLTCATIAGSLLVAPRFVNSDDNQQNTSSFHVRGETIIATDDLKVLRITVSAPSGSYVGKTCSTELGGGGGFHRLPESGQSQELVWTIALHRGRIDGDKPTTATYSWDFKHSGSSSLRTQTDYAVVDRSFDRMLALEVTNGKYEMGTQVHCFQFDSLKYGIQVSDIAEVFNDTK